MATKKTASGSAADGPKAMPREKLARRVYEYGGGGNVNMNAVSQAIERGETAPPVALRNTLAQIDEYLSWPNGSRMGGPLGGKIDHAELREIRGLLGKLVPRALPGKPAAGLICRAGAPFAGQAQPRQVRSPPSEDGGVTR